MTFINGGVGQIEKMLNLELAIASRTDPDACPDPGGARGVIRSFRKSSFVSRCDGVAGSSTPCSLSSGIFQWIFYYLSKENCFLFWNQ